MIGIDLGSNTIRICKFDGFKKIKSDEKIVGSAIGLMPDKILQNEAKDRIINALNEFKLTYDFDGEILAVATEAFRIAKNSKEFFDEIKNKFGINFKIITGEDEAKFTKIAIDFALQRLKISNQNMLYIDMGGASTEIIFKNFKKSFKFGIVKFCEFCKNDIKIMQKNASKEILEAKNFLNNFDFKKIALNSGVPTTIAALKIGLNYENYDANLINGTKLEINDFKNWAKKLENEKNANFLVGKNRKFLIIAGSLLFIELLKGVKSEICAIDDGLREGVIIDCLLKNV